MSIEAMKQALEALETLNSGDSYKTHNAATTLRKAIAEAEKPWVKTYAGGKPNYTAPVHASDMSQERVDETAKDRHDLWIAAACLKSTVESAIKAGDWKVDGACDPTRDLAYLADCLANPKREWVGLTDEEKNDETNN